MKKYIAIVAAFAVIAGAAVALSAKCTQCNGTGWNRIGTECAFCKGTGRN